MPPPEADDPAVSVGERGLSCCQFRDLVAESGRLRPSAAACANDKGGAVWDAFRENANCGDPVGTLPGNCGVRVHFAGA